MADWINKLKQVVGIRPNRRGPGGGTDVSDVAASIADIQRAHPGLWVAVRDGDVVEVRETPHALVMALHERDITGATVFRCPDLDEAELVGLG